MTTLGAVVTAVVTTAVLATTAVPAAASTARYERAALERPERPVRQESAAPERVVRDEVALTVRPDGVVHVKETIVYAFSGTRGIERSLITKRRYSDTRDRVFKVSGIAVTSPDGGPAKATTAERGDRTVIKVSAPGPLTGRRTVVLEYDVRGAIVPMGAGQELRWTAIGGWRVPLDDARVTVDAAAVVRNINCFSGPLESAIGCSQFFTNHTHTQSDFRQRGMLADEYVTVAVGYPADMTKGRPLYERRRTLATAFSVNTVTAGSLLGLLVLLLGGLALLYRLRGRDARVVGRKAVEGDHPPLAGQGDARSFEPPDGVRPGQIGTLIDEQADVIDVTATIVDLAVRGYLLIEEEDRATTGRMDWALRRLDRPDTDDADDTDLHRYERILLEALFADRDVVKLSELGGTFAEQLAKVRDAMYADVVEQGWFAHRPDRTRSRWTTAGMVLTGLGLVGTVALAIFTDLALVGLAVIIAGAALTVGGQYMPAKTAKGTTVLAHTIGFRAYLAHGEASDVVGEPGADLDGSQRIALFSRYLPYAVVFDSVGRWAEIVEDAGVRAEGADNLAWYEGPAEWDLSRFAESMRTFTLTTSGAISQTRQFRTI